MAKLRKSKEREKSRKKAQYGQRGNSKWVQLLREQIIKRGDKHG